MEWLALCLGYSGVTGFLISVVTGCFDIVCSFTQSLHKYKDSALKEVTAASFHTHMFWWFMIIFAICEVTIVSLDKLWIYQKFLNINTVYIWKSYGSFSKVDPFKIGLHSAILWSVLQITWGERREYITFNLRWTEWRWADLSPSTLVLFSLYHSTNAPYWQFCHLLSVLYNLSNWLCF